jgi:hypothetical protein
VHTAGSERRRPEPPHDWLEATRIIAPLEGEHLSGKLRISLFADLPPGFSRHLTLDGIQYGNIDVFTGGPQPPTVELTFDPPPVGAFHVAKLQIVKDSHESSGGAPVTVRETSAMFFNGDLHENVVSGSGAAGASPSLPLTPHNTP